MTRIRHAMRRYLLSLGFLLPLFARQGFAQPAFDFRSLDKFDALTEHKTKVTLDGDMLKLASRFLANSDDSDAEALRSLTNNLRGIYIRTWEFDHDWQYSRSDIEPFRAYLKQQQWSKIVESQDGKEYSEVYILPLSGDRFGGVAIISAEARELTVVYISGALNLSDLDKLEGNMGIPEIDLKNARKPPPPAKDKKED